ncbi:hypothetical protein SAMN06265350_101393 [Solitalea koreensis]|uniref:Uncharacterized protein n=1 Tax=Solitalea koreensis TaxID=543615 RepID=A0A521ATL2_9SPHI|nr:hypothetical protein SAMN06265350_101393 [Solitalea koreensis]
MQKTMKHELVILSKVEGFVTLRNRCFDSIQHDLMRLTFETDSLPAEGYLWSFQEGL